MSSLFTRYALAVLMGISVSACTTTGTETGHHSKTGNATGSPAAFQFSIVGDLPYNDTQAFSLKRFITPAIGDSAFVIHVGDYKAGNNQACTTDLDEKHKAWMTSVGVPVFYTPGDNDWADCDRASNAPVVRETVRLAQIRSAFFNPVPADAPPEWQIVRQEGAPENARWMYNDVLFATAHVIGGNNGRDTHEPCAVGALCDTAAEIAQLVEKREIQALDWINSTFDAAMADRAAAVVVAVHADMFENENAGVECQSYAQIECDGFFAVRRSIVDRSAAFQKPVLLLHGDTLPFCWDRKMGGTKAPNLLRLNAAGDYVLVDAVDVVVDPNSETPFHAKGVLSHLLPAENTCR